MTGAETIRVSGAKDADGRREPPVAAPNDRPAPPLSDPGLVLAACEDSEWCRLPDGGLEDRVRVNTRRVE